MLRLDFLAADDGFNKLRLFASSHHHENNTLLCPPTSLVFVSFNCRWGLCRSGPMLSTFLFHVLTFRCRHRDKWMLGSKWMIAWTSRPQYVGEASGKNGHICFVSWAKCFTVSRVVALNALTDSVYLSYCIRHFLTLRSVSLLVWCVYEVLENVPVPA